MRIVLAALWAIIWAGCTPSHPTKVKESSEGCAASEVLSGEAKKAFGARDYAAAEGGFRAAALRAAAEDCPSNWAASRANMCRAIRAGDKAKGALRAIDTLLADLAVARRLYPQTAGIFHFQLARAYFTRSAYWKSLPHYEQAEQADQMGHYVTDQSGHFLYLPLGNLYTRLGEYEKAIHLLKIGVDSAAAQQDTLGLCKLQGDLGLAYFSQGDLSSAAARYETGIALSEAACAPESDDWRANRSVLLSNMAELKRQQQQMADAERLAHESLEYDDANPEAYGLLGALAFVRGDTVAADTLSDIAETLYRDEGLALTRSLAKVLLQRAGRTGPLQANMERCQEALTCVLPHFVPNSLFEHPNPNVFYPENTILEALQLKGQLAWARYQAEGDTKWLYLADTSAMLALVAYDTLLTAYGFETSKMGAGRDARALHALQMRVLHERFLRLGEQSAGERLVTFSEKVRGVLLRQKMAEEVAALAAPIPIHLKKESDNLLQKIRGLKNLWNEQVAEGEDAEQTQRAITAASLKLQTVKSEILRCASAYAKATQGDTTYDLAGLRRGLPDNKTFLVEYFHVPETNQLYIIACSKDSIRCAERSLPVATINYFLDTLRHPEVGIALEGDSTFRGKFVAQAHALYQALLAPVFPQGPPGKMIVATDGILGNLPFDLLLPHLPPPTAQGFHQLPYLLRRTAVSVVPSLSALLTAEARHAAVPGCGYLGLAPSYCGHFRPTYYGATAVKQGAHLFDGQCKTGFFCTKERFWTDASSCQILHFYGHGHADGNQPEASFLAFAQPTERFGHCPPSRELDSPRSILPTMEHPRVLYAHEIRSMNLRADLAILDACETGIGQNAGPEGALSLARAFMDAGCRSTLMALWKVDAQSTAVISGHFLHFIKEGLPKDEALRQAKLAFLDNSTSAAPFLWAGMVLSGDANAIVVQDCRQGPLSFAGREWVLMLGLLLVCCWLIWAIFRH